MDEKTEALLRELAEKFDTTGEHLWGVLVRQAYISGIIDLLVIAAWVALFVVLFYVLHHKTKTPEATQNNRHPSAAISDEAAILLWTAYAFFIAIFALIVGDSISGILGALLNPEYWALSKLLTAVK